MTLFRTCFHIIVLVTALLVTLPVYAWKMEAGKLLLDATTNGLPAQVHTFQQLYDTPPIVIVLPTSSGANSSSVRISDVTTLGFKAYPVEPKSEDGPHASMTVSYVAIEAGSHTLPNGEKIEAGKLSTSRTQFNGTPNGLKRWETLAYNATFSSPILIADIQTTRNEIGALPSVPSEPWLTVAIDNITNTQANIALERSEVFDSQIGSNYQFNALLSTEDIGYIVMDRGLLGNFRTSGNLVINFETLYSANRVVGWSDGCNGLNFIGTYSSPPIAVANKSTRNEADGGWLRECSIDANQIQLTVEEDNDQDSERNHTDEDVSLLIFSQSFFYDSNAASSLKTSDELMLESGSAVLSPSSFTNIAFEQIYEYPPAVFILGNNQNPEPSSVRIRNVSTQGFEAIPVEPDSKVADAADQPTAVHYMAISKGEFEFPDGKKVEIGPLVPPTEIIHFQSKLLSGPLWFNFNFSSNFNSLPAFLSQIQSMNNEPSHTPGSPSQPWMTTATKNINATGGSIALDRAETITGLLTSTEEFAYLAMNPGIISDFLDADGNTILSEAQTTADSIAGARSCDTANFLQSYTDVPLVIGSQTTWDGGDGGWLRRCSTSNTHVDLKIEEDWAYDTDNSHTSERASFLTFSEPFFVDFSLVANYQLEGPLWNNIAGEVIDSSNNGLHGRALGDTTVFPAKVCNGAVFDGDEDYIEIPDSPDLDIRDELTVMAWVKPKAFPGSDLMTIVSKDTNFEFHIEPDGKVFWWWNSDASSGRELDSNATKLSLDTWQHVAIMYSKSQASQKIYINGVEVGASTYANETLVNNSLPMYIGRDYAQSTRFFNGSIDEVKVFKRALSGPAIQKYANRTRPCGSCILDRFDISQHPSALACPDTRTEVDIIAKCVDGTDKADYAGTIALSGPSGSVFYDQESGGNVITSLAYNFADNGKKKAYLYFNNEATDVKVSAEDSAASVTSTASTGTNFNAFGFRVTQNPSSFVCGTHTNMTLSAYGKIDNTPGGSCQVLTGFSGNKTMNAWYRANVNNDPAPDILNDSITLNGTAISEESNANNDNLSLNFTNGESSFDIAYDDAAQFLDINFELDDAQYKQMTASTPSFVAYPERLHISAKNSSGADISGAASTHKAGELFEIELSAQCRDNANNYTTASRYAPNNASTSIMTYLQRLAPLNGQSVEGELIMGSKNLYSDDDTSLNWQPSGFTSGDFNNGIYTLSNASFSEVGSMRLHFNDANYFGESMTPTSINLGRFTPSHFSVDVSHGSFEAFCTLGAAKDFSYIGQTIQYQSPPNLTIQALNTNNTVTQNYTEGSFLKLNTTDTRIKRIFPSYDTLKFGTDGLNKMAISTVNNPPSSFSSAEHGVMVYNFKNTDSFEYTRDSNALVNAFDSDIKIVVEHITDEDGIKSDAQPYELSPTAIELRYGRWAMSNAFGPETEHLPIPLKIEYWDGSTFKTNSSDHCSIYHKNDLSIDDTSLSGGSTTASGNGTLISGKSPLNSLISLSAPGKNNTGTVDLELMVDAWLQYDWDNNPLTPDTNPTATASFGQYRGHDRIIYWREVNR